MKASQAEGAWHQSESRTAAEQQAIPPDRGRRAISGGQQAWYLMEVHSSSVMAYLQVWAVVLNDVLHWGGMIPLQILQRLVVSDEQRVKFPLLEHATCVLHAWQGGDE